MEGLILHSFRNILAPKTAEVAKSLVEVQEALNIKSDELSKCTLSVIDTETLCLLGMINWIPNWPIYDLTFFFSVGGVEAEHERTVAELQEAIHTVSEFQARIIQELASVQLN